MNSCLVYMEGIVSKMHAVYSFGVILLQIISGMCYLNQLVAKLQLNGYVTKTITRYVCACAYHANYFLFACVVNYAKFLTVSLIRWAARLSEKISAI